MELPGPLHEGSAGIGGAGPKHDPGGKRQGNWGSGRPLQKHRKRSLLILSVALLLTPGSGTLSLFDS